MESELNSWQLQIGPGDGQGPTTFEALRISAPQLRWDLVDGVLITYVGSQDEAREIYCRDTMPLEWAQILQWQPASSTWRVVACRGDRSLPRHGWTMETVTDERPRKSMVTTQFVVALLVVAAAVLTFLVVYFVGGIPGSSVGDRPGDVTVALTAAITVGGGGTVVLALRRSRL